MFLLLTAIGPFTQQSIKSFSCERPLHNISASISAASYVNSSLALGTQVGHVADYPDLTMMTAALEGIVGSADSSKTVPFDCPTGNCDFPPYSSLAYCSSCTDITARVEEHYDLLLLGKQHIWNYIIPGQDCRLSFEAPGDSPSLYTSGLTTGVADQLKLCPWNIFYDASLRQSANSFMVMALSKAVCSPDLEYGDSERPDCVDQPEQLPSLANLSALIAMNCTFGLCLRDYTGRVRNGELLETMTSGLDPNLLPADEVTDMFKILKLPCTVDSNNYDLSNMSQIPHIPGRSFTPVRLDGRNVSAPRECVFTTEATLPWTINYFLHDGLFRQGYSSEHNGEATCSFGSYDGRSRLCDPWYLEPLYHGGSPTAATISSYMDGIAVAITNRMRAVGSNLHRDGPGVVRGTAIQTTVCVRVEWPWLLFPAMLVLLTAVLFVAVLLAARRSQIADGQPIWKSSAIVAFFHGIDGRPHAPGPSTGDSAHPIVSAHGAEDNPASASWLKGEGYQGLMTLEDMHAKAKKVVVKLETAVPGQRGFVVVKEEENGHRIDFSRQGSQRCSSDSHHEEQRLPLHRLPSNDSLELREEPPTFSQVDLGIGLSLSISSHPDRSI